VRGAVHRPRRRFPGVCDRRAGARCDQCKCRGCSIIPCRLPSECPGAARSVTAAPRHSTRRLLRRALHLAIELGAQYDRGDRKRCALSGAQCKRYAQAAHVCPGLGQAFEGNAQPEPLIPRRCRQRRAQRNLGRTRRPAGGTQCHCGCRRELLDTHGRYHGELAVGLARPVQRSIGLQGHRGRRPETERARYESSAPASRR